MPTKPKPRSIRKTDPPVARAPRPTQLRVPGTDTLKYPDVEAAAEIYVDVRDRRMALTKDETAASATLLAAMKSRGLQVYRLETDEGNLLVTVDEATTVHVRKEKEPRARPSRNGDGAVRP